MIQLGKCQLVRLNKTQCIFFRWHVNNVPSEQHNIPNTLRNQVIIQNEEGLKVKNQTIVDTLCDSLPELNLQLKKEKVNKNDENFRKNDLNIQMLSRHLYNQLFPPEDTISKNKDVIKAALSELKKHGLPGSLHKIPDITLNLPEIFNNNIEDHFHLIGEQQCSAYRTLLNNLLNPIPQIPQHWNYSPGWTKYKNGAEPISVNYPEEDALIFDVEVCCKEGELPTLATAVSTDAWYGWVSKELIKGNSHIGKKNYSTDNLIPLETDSKIKTGRLTDSCLQQRIIVGHNVSYDRVRIREQYFLERTGMRFMDTMSLHICISGITSYQKLLLKSKLPEDSEWTQESSLNGLSDVHKFYCGEGIAKEERNIFVTGKYKDVIDNFQSLMTYCARDVQATHDIFLHLWPQFLTRFSHPVTLAGMLELSTCYLPVTDNWKRYIENSQQSYDDLDIEANLLLTQEADYACQLLHNEKFKNDLWLWDQDWNIKQLKLKKAKPVKEKRHKKVKESKKELKGQENKVPFSININSINCNSETETTMDTEYKFNTQKEIEMEQKFANLINSVERLPVRIPHLAGYPEWYRKLCSSTSASEWKPGAHLISTSMKITPKLLRLTWKSMPLHYIRTYGWGFLVPYNTEEIQLPADEELTIPFKKLQEHCTMITGADESVNEIHVDMDCAYFDNLEKSLMESFYGNENKYIKKKNVNCRNISFGNVCGFIKLPHKNGDGLNVGNPLAKDFIDKYTECGLDGKSSKAAKIIEINRQLSYWKNNRERIENQFVVWLKRKDLPSTVKTSRKYGVILPKVIVCGTLTRRAVESTWMTASNATDERIGSELRCMIQVPDGYSLVGADVDSQELWIASLIGDAYFGKEHGCTPFGWMTISGDKADGTDMHSMTAKTMGISRTNAKIINYARIYGAGQYFAERLLKQFIPNISASDVKDRASKMFRKTKGYHIFELKSNCLPEQTQRHYYRPAAKELLSVFNKNIDELFNKPKWIGGSESAMFNRLEEIANCNKPVTPFLHCQLSRAVQPSLKNSNKFLPTRINWVVQSGAVDFLHLMLVCMRWLIDPKARFCLSFHDEVHYLVPEKQRYQTALALHVTNLLTRAFCVRRLGMVDMPQSVAFFSSVEIDTVLRKEANNDCKTPSNPHGLSKGYGIPLGESLSIEESIKKANGVIGIHKHNTTGRNK